MKKIKVATLFLGLITAGLTVSIQNEAEAQGSTKPKFKISAETCEDAFGNTTGWGNICVLGSGSCVANPCAPSQIEMR